MCRGGPAGRATAATRDTGRDAYLVAETFLDTRAAVAARRDGRAGRATGTTGTAAGLSGLAGGTAGSATSDRGLTRRSSSSSLEEQASSMAMRRARTSLRERRWCGDRCEGQEVVGV